MDKGFNSGRANLWPLVSKIKKGIGGVWEQFDLILCGLSSRSLGAL